MIRIDKKFDIVMSLMDEMMGDISKLYPQKISFNVMGDVCEFVDVKIELHNGFLKVIGGDEICVIRYKDVCGYSLKSFNPPYIVDDDGDAIHFNGDFDDLIFFDEIWRDLSGRGSTLPQTLLNKVIPWVEFEKMVSDYLMEYEGLCERDEIFDGDYIERSYNNWLEWYKSKSPSYGDLNDSMSEDLWELHYPSHILRDDCKFNFKRGEDWSIKDYLWINDVISHYWRFDDEDIEMYKIDELFDGVDDDE